MIFIDLRYEGSEELDKIACIAKKLGYKIICIEGLDKVQIVNDIIFIPRYSSSNISNLVRIKSNIVKAYEIKSVEDLKSYPKLRKLAVVVSLHSSALYSLTREGVERLLMLGLPVEVAIRDVYNVVTQRKYVKGLNYLVNAVESGLELIACSGARKYTELLHPRIIISLLIELGLDEVDALKAISSTPAKLLRGLGYVIK